MDYFDYESVADEAHISPEELERLCALMREDFPHDQMMFELHVLGACLNVRDGYVTIDEALGRKAAEASSVEC